MRLRVPFLLLLFSLSAVVLAHLNQPTPIAADDAQSFNTFFPHVTNDLCGPILEPFDDPIGSWFTGQSGDLVAEIEGGEYRLRFTTPGSVWMIPGPLCLRTEYVAAVDVRWGGITGNFIGLLFGIDDARQRAYLFAVNTDTQAWMVFEVRPGDLRTIIEPTRNQEVRPGLEINRLAAERSQESIILSVNGLQVGELPVDVAGTAVIAGVAAAAYTDQYQTDARFDSFAWRDN